MPATFRAAIGRRADSLYGRGEDLANRARPAPAPSAVAESAPQAAPRLSPPGGPRIGFGCAGLMQSPSGRHRQRLLAEVFEQGIRHFDVARMYGLGAAERELGRFARGRREQLTIATKFGIEPAGPAGRLARLQAPARAAVARLPALRAALKRRADAFHQPRRYDLATLRTSLHTSLRELGTEYVDVLLIHDPAPGDALDMEELGEALEQLRVAGRVRAWGLAGDPEPCLELYGRAGGAEVLQIRDDVLGDDVLGEALARAPAGAHVITFGVLSGALQRIVGHVAGSAERRRRWRETVGADCGRPEVVSSLLLQDALARNAEGAVLFSTRRPERIGQAVAAAAALAHEPRPTPLRAFQELVRAELGRPPRGRPHG
jgi:D-threo-aldose 1-dehydrogenase